MKLAGMVVAAILLSGCAATTSLEELEQRAMLTGDWSEVEQREKIIARRKARQGPSCPSGQVAVCQRRLGESRCACVNNDAIAGVFGR